MRGTELLEEMTDHFLVMAAMLIAWNECTERVSVAHGYIYDLLIAIELLRRNWRSFGLQRHFGKITDHLLGWGKPRGLRVVPSNHQKKKEYPVAPHCLMCLCKQRTRLYLFWKVNRERFMTRIRQLLHLEDQRREITKKKYRVALDRCSSWCIVLIHNFSDK